MRPSPYVPLAVPEGVRASARRTPTKVALREGDRELTYAALQQRIDRVSNAAAFGLQLTRGTHAAIMAPNCLEFVEIVLGLAQVGVAPAMVNYRSSPAELAFICNDAEARVLFVHAAFEEIAREAALETVERVIVLGDEYEQWLALASPGAPSVQIEEWDPFFLPYTAGTTGTPKGVLLPHRARTLSFYAMGVEFGCYRLDARTLGISPLFHGAGFSFSVAPLFFGGETTLLPSFEPEELLRLIEAHRITNAFMVPTHFNAIFALGEAALSRFDTSSVETLISNAAPLPQATKERIVAKFGNEVLFEIYGSTEGGIATSLRPVDQLRKFQCAGQPWPCAQVRVVDELGEDVAVGEVGELHTRSPYQAVGYWRRPEATEVAFRGGWFASGDMARQDDQGYVYLVDRKNDTIISGGVNIYPREIEEVLSRHPAVVEAAVFGIPDDYWGESVHAAVALAAGVTVKEAELLAFCESSELAHFKRPRGIDVIASLPKNPAGKILRRQLREPHWAGRARGI